MQKEEVRKKEKIWTQEEKWEVGYDKTNIFYEISKYLNFAQKKEEWPEKEEW